MGGLRSPMPPYFCFDCGRHFARPHWEQLVGEGRFAGSAGKRSQRPERDEQNPDSEKGSTTGSTGAGR